MRAAVTTRYGLPEVVEGPGGTDTNARRQRGARPRSRVERVLWRPEKQVDLVFLQELIDAGKLRTVIGRRYTLDEIAEAHRYADTGHKIGNVAVLIGNQTTQDR